MKNIKAFFIIATLFVVTAMVSTSCGIDEPTNFEESLLIGKWKNGTDHQVYKADYTGYTWDTADDVTEEEAQDFTWTLEVDILTHIHVFEKAPDGTRSVPKTYTVKELSDSTLIYEDELGGKSYTFTKVVDSAQEN